MCCPGASTTASPGPISSVPLIGGLAALVATFAIFHQLTILVVLLALFDAGLLLTFLSIGLSLYQEHLRFKRHKTEVNQRLLELPPQQPTNLETLAPGVLAALPPTAHNTIIEQLIVNNYLQQTDARHVKIEARATAPQGDGKPLVIDGQVPVE